MNKHIAICLHGQKGDLMTAMSVLKYRQELWGDTKIIWYAAQENFDLLKYQDNLEIREFPRGYGYPEMVKVENKKLIEDGKEPIWRDWQDVVNENNHLMVTQKNRYPEFIDAEFGYFPAPHQMSVEKRNGLEYPNCSKKVFGINDNYEWHPVLKFSSEDRIATVDFINKLPPYKNIAIESFAGSSQSKITDIQVINAMDICRCVLGKCNFIFMSHKFVNGNEKFPEGLINNEDVFSAAHFTVRQCALIVEQCDLLTSVSSGISVAASAWGLNPTPIIQLCGSLVCSTKALALGRFELITTDGKQSYIWWNEFETKLIEMLNEI